MFLAANPRGTDYLALDREARSIRAELKRSGYRDRFEFKTRWAAEPLDLLREVREIKPTVLHFSGHGGTHAASTSSSRAGREVTPGSSANRDESCGLYFQDADGAAQMVSHEAIAQAIGAAGASVKLVVLNACFTELIAESLLAHVDCVVGISGSIQDEAARSFAIGFYGGLGEYASIESAFVHGKAAINLEGFPDAELPRLKVRQGFNATQLILAAIAPVLREELRCPYPGMRPYAADDTAGFYGREAEVNDLLGRLRAGEREIYVIGPSGSGKSSLVSAGVLPRLARGVAGMSPFIVRNMRPGDQPAIRLYQALEAPAGRSFNAPGLITTMLAYRGAGSSVLIVIDQLEELFTLANAKEREQFLAALRALRTEPRFVAIFTLRADFYGALMESPLWTEHGGRLSRIDVGPLDDAALRDAISRPSEDLGVVVESQLIERLLADAASEPGILPLLQETMVQLWDVRADQTLTLADYEVLGDGERSGLAVSLTRRADATLRRFTPNQTIIARRVLLRLISFGEGRSDTRRQQSRSKLRATTDDADDFAYVMQQMVDSRLLTTNEDDERGEARVDLGHEVMITAWPTLIGWIRSHRLDEQRRRQFELAAAVWVEHNRGPRGLLDPIELADAQTWQRTESALQLGHSAEVNDFIAVSRAVQAKKRRRRRNLVRAVFATLTAFAVIVGVLAHNAREQALRARAETNRATASDHESRSRLSTIAQAFAESGRQLIADGHFQEAVPYLLEARRNGEEGSSLRKTFWAASRRLPLVPTLEHRERVVGAAFSPDGTRVVTASWDKTARVWDTATGRPVSGHLEHRSGVLSAAFSLDGTRVVTGSYDHSARVWDAETGIPITGPLNHAGWVVSAVFSPDGTHVATASGDKTARIWDAATGQLIASLEHQDKVWSAAFSHDGARVVTASGDKTAQVWDAITGNPVIHPLEHHAAVSKAEFSADDTRVVTASYDKTARVWNANTGKPITGPLQHQRAVVSASFSTDGARVVTASDDQTARVWDAITGEPVTEPLEHYAAVRSVAFNPEGTRVIVASSDRTVRVWDAATGEPVTTFEHQARVSIAAFSSDGTRVITASDDKTARIWDATIAKPVIGPFEHQGWVVNAAFSPDGLHVVTASYDRTARVWDAATSKRVPVRLEHQGWVVSAAFSLDGHQVVTASDDRTARVWDAVTGNPITSPLVHQARVSSATFSPDGSRVVTASDDQTARVWDATTGNPVTTPLQHQRAVRAAAFSPDGTRIVTASDDQIARVWDAATGALLTKHPAHRRGIRTATFSPDGTRVVTASDDQTAHVWHASTGELLMNPLKHHGKVVSATFSPDGTHIVTASDDRTARVWDAATGMPVAGPLAHQAQVLSAAFSPDGTRVVTASADKTARVWDVATGSSVTTPFEHQSWVVMAAFSPNGSHVVTASWDRTARVWDVRLEEETIESWSKMAERSPFVLKGVTLKWRTRSQLSGPAR